jgi:hypothetical protein
MHIQDIQNQHDIPSRHQEQTDPLKPTISTFIIFPVNPRNIPASPGAHGSSPSGSQTITNELYTFLSPRFTDFRVSPLRLNTPGPGDRSMRKSVGRDPACLWSDTVAVTLLREIHVLWCVYVYVYVCMYIVCTYTLRERVYGNACTYTDTSPCLYTYVCVCIYVCMYMYIYIYIYMHMYSYIHKHVYMYTLTASSQSCSFSVYLLFGSSAPVGIM